MSAHGLRRMLLAVVEDREVSYERMACSPKLKSKPNIANFRVELFPLVKCVVTSLFCIETLSIYYYIA